MSYHLVHTVILIGNQDMQYLYYLPTEAVTHELSFIECSLVYTFEPTFFLFVLPDRLQIISGALRQLHAFTDFGGLWLVDQLENKIFG